MPGSPFEALDALASRLPFHLEDTDAANAAFVRWRSSGSDADRRIVQLWTYCFIRRYYTVKFVQDSGSGAADLDELIDKTFLKAEESSSEIKTPDRYTAWVSVICKNNYLNYLRSRKPALSLDAEGGPELVAEKPAVYDDVGLARDAVRKAIERLPAYLQECATLRFVDGLSYEEMSERTGHPLPRIRSYVNKAVARFRSDETLLAYLRRED